MGVISIGTDHGEIFREECHINLTISAEFQGFTAEHARRYIVSVNAYQFAILEDHPELLSTCPLSGASLTVKDYFSVWADQFHINHPPRARNSRIARVNADNFANRLVKLEDFVCAPVNDGHLNSVICALIETLAARQGAPVDIYSRVTVTIELLTSDRANSAPAALRRYSTP